MSLESYVRGAESRIAPHLEGAIQPRTLLELARRNKRALPHDTPDGLRDWFRLRDFAHFAEVHGAISSCLLTSDDFEPIVYEVAAELERQNARYAELGFLPAFHARAGVKPETYMRGLASARRRVQAELGVELAFIFDLGRSWAGIGS